jgi:hypothetical protein
MREKSGTLRSSPRCFTIRELTWRADFSHEYRFVRVFLAALGAPASVSACFEAGTPIRDSRVWRCCGIGISVKYDVTATGRCTQHRRRSVPLPSRSLIANYSLLPSVYRDFSQADSPYAFSVRGCSYHVTESSTGSCIGGTRLTMRED